MYAIFTEIDLVLTLLGHFKSQKMTCVFCQSEVHYEILFVLKII